MIERLFIKFNFNKLQIKNELRKKIFNEAVSLSFDLILFFFSYSICKWFKLFYALMCVYELWLLQCYLLITIFVDGCL